MGASVWAVLRMVTAGALLRIEIFKQYGLVLVE
jgi:hypothetical protein